MSSLTLPVLLSSHICKMDIGVGSFVFSQGIVSAIPLVKNPAHLREPLLPKFTMVLRKCLPVLLLGLFRTVSVKGTEYPVSNTSVISSILCCNFG